jgi:F-type H+-transporting ATPase subunit epsilon
MNLQIITPQGTKHSGEVSRVQFRSAMGLMEVLDNHAPMIAELRAGTIVTDVGEFACGNGVVKVNENQVKVICE